MKYIYPLLLVVLCTGTANAQTPSSSYTLVSTGVGTIFLKDPGNTTQIGFTYYQNGTTGTFQSFLQDSMPRRLQMIQVPDLELVYNKDILDLGAGFYNDLGNDYAFHIRAGYKHLFTVNDLQIKPGLALDYFFGVNEPMGSIDNHSEVDLFGFQAMESWTEDSDDGNGGTVTNTYYADHLDVDYNRSALALEPSLTLSINPVGRLFFNIQAGYALQLVQSYRINLVQQDGSGNSNKVGTLHLDHNGSLSGLMVGFSVGFAIDHKQ